MGPEFQKHKKISLRDTGKNEKWLQAEIAADPSILGLGELVVYRKEVRQSSGGRLDMLLSDAENLFLYEVEIMLGATDPSHIIRTIEYWDVETRRYPKKEHRAVIVAEEITNRFFNVIWLLSRSIPIVALQLDVLKTEDKLLLHFTKVLDLSQQPDADDEQPASISDRKSWDDYAPKAMGMFDQLIALLSQNNLKPELRFRQDGIALAGERNIAKVVPRKSGTCLLVLYARIPEEIATAGREQLEKAGVSVRVNPEGRFSLQLDSLSLSNGGTALVGMFKAGLEVDF